MSDAADEEAITAAALRRKQLIIAGILGAIIVVGVVAAVVLSTTLRTSSNDPTSPDDAARQWATAVITHDTSRQNDLQCAGNHTSGTVTKISGATTASLGVAPAVPNGTNEWNVEVTIHGSTVAVPVEEQNGRYLVC